MFRNKHIFALLFLLFASVSGTSSHAQIQPKSLPMETTVQGYSLPQGPQGKNLLAITLTMEPDWYTYSNIPIEMGKPTKVAATAADGTMLQIIYPEGKDKPDTFDPSKTIKAFVSGTTLFAIIPNDVATPFPVSLRLDLLLCHPTKCVPARLEVTFDDPGVLAKAVDQEWWASFQKLSGHSSGPTTGSREVEPTAAEEAAIMDWQFSPTYLQPGLEVTSLLSAVLMGLLAGLILNIMPCVLPVVSLKLSALLGACERGQQDAPYQAFRMHNVFFVLGVLSFFLFLALVLGATGKAWGALFQYSWLVLILAGIMTALGASLFGFFHLPVIDLKFDEGHKSPHKQAYFTGMLTTLLATPCSGPFLGGVLGWALIQGPATIVAVFISIGLGMASPYLLLILNPRLARFLPRSGPWIEYVEKGIGFFLLGTAFYLASIALGSSTLRILIPLWVALFGGWIVVRTRAGSMLNKWFVRILAAAMLIGVIAATTPPELEANPWETFDPIVLHKSIGSQPIFVDFTADWCPTCKALEATVLTDENVAKWKRKYRIRFIKVDMTERDPEAEALLLALGSRSIPTAAMFKRDQPDTPLVLRDLFTVKEVEKILKSL